MQKTKSSSEPTRSPIPKANATMSTSNSRSVPALQLTSRLNFSDQSGISMTAPRPRPVAVCRASPAALADKSAAFFRQDLRAGHRWQAALTDALHPRVLLTSVEKYDVGDAGTEIGRRTCAPIDRPSPYGSGLIVLSTQHQDSPTRPRKLWFRSRRSGTSLRDRMRRFTLQRSATPVSQQAQYLFLGGDRDAFRRGRRRRRSPTPHAADRYSQSRPDSCNSQSRSTLARTSANSLHHNVFLTTRSGKPSTDRMFGRWRSRNCSSYYDGTILAHIRSGR